MVGLQRPGQLVRDCAHLFRRLRSVECCIEVYSFAAARHRHRVEANPCEDVAGEPGDLGALQQARALARIEVEHQSVGVLPLADAGEFPLRDMQFERGGLRQPHKGGSIAHERVVVGMVGMFDATPDHPLGRALVEVLLKEHGPWIIRGSDPVNPAFAGDRTVADVGDQRVRDSRVVVEHVGFGRARLGIHHLVKVGERDRAAIDRDLRAGGGVRAGGCSHPFIFVGPRCIGQRLTRPRRAAQPLSTASRC